jgi:predicted TIM-barrel enzyme
MARAASFIGEAAENPFINASYVRIERIASPLSSEVSVCCTGIIVGRTGVTVGGTEGAFAGTGVEDGSQPATNMIKATRTILFKD